MTDRHMKSHRPDASLRDLIAWKNVSGEVVPAYGVVQFRTSFTSGFSQASKPDGEDGLYYVNGPVEVAAGRHGESALWNRPQRVAVSDDVGVGDQVGPVAGSWRMSLSGSGFFVLRQSAAGVAVVERAGTGGGGTHRIEFEIDEVVCATDEEPYHVLVEWTWHSAGCGDPPGMEYDGRIKVYDTCLMKHLTSEQLLGRTGWATYWYRRDSCETMWKIDSLCDALQCDEVT